MAKRICPKCRNIYSRDTVVCPQCGMRLADVDYDFEMALSMIQTPVLLSDHLDADPEYLETALKKRNIPFFTEELKRPVPTGNIRMGTMDIMPTTNYYVDEGDWEEACEALREAKEETRKDEEAPVLFLDMPPEEEVEEEEPGTEAEQRGDGDTGSFMAWFLGVEPAYRMNLFIIGSVALAVVLGLILALVSLV